MPDPNFSQSLSSASNAGFSPASSNAPVLPCGKVVETSSYDPCDVDMLKLSVSEKKGDGASVKCTEPASVDGSLTAEHRVLLAGSDLLLEVVADYHRDGSYDPDSLSKAKIIIEGITSPACPKGDHSLITWKGGAGSDAVDENWRMAQPDIREVLSQSTRSFTKTGGFLAPYWPFMEDRKAVFIAAIESCGIRDGVTPVTSLNGRVAVYPNDSFELTMKIPPMRKVSWKEGKSLDLKSGETTRSSSHTESKDFGREEEGTSTSRTTGSKVDYSTQTRSESSGGLVTTTEKSSGQKNFKESDGTKTNGVFFEDSTQVSQRGLASSRTLAESREVRYSQTTSAEKMEFTDETAQQGISLKYNGTELDISKTITLFKAAEGFKKAFEDFKNTVPKIGWQADLDIGVLEGSITGSWGMRTKSSATHPRIWEVENFFQITVDVKLFFLKAEVGFGLDLVIENWFSSNPLLELILKITLSFELTLPLKGSFSSSSKENLALSAAAEGVPKLEAKARASAVGYTYEASASLSGCLKATGTFKCGFAQPPIAEGKVEWSPLVLVGVVCRPDTDPWRKELLRYPDVKDPKPIWEGALPTAEDKKNP